MPVISTIPGPGLNRYKPVGATAASGGPGVNPVNLQGVVSDLLTFNAQAEQFDAAAAGSALTAEGASAEAAAYGTATGIANENQQAEAQAEQIRQVQLTREVNQTVGGIGASVAANGFQQSGSALDIMASSYQQGYLSEQISGMQSAQVQRGYLEQAAAATGEMDAANARGAAAAALTGAQTDAANSARANSGALTSALTQLLSGDPNAQKLVNDITTGNTAGAVGDALLYNPAGSGQPLGAVGTTSTTPSTAATTWYSGPAPASNTGFGVGTFISPFSAGTGNSGPLAVIPAGTNVSFKPFSG